MKLYFRSLLLLLALYGLVFAVGDLYLSRHGAPLWVALAFAGGIVVLQYGLGPWLIQFFLKIHWDDLGNELPARNREFLLKICADRGLKMPRIGIIDSATPNAFTFGHVPADARVVVTTGLLKILTPEESNAVLGHEMGHVEHYDFIVMTLAALAPLLLYQVYAFTRGSDKGRPVALGAYLAYWVSRYMVAMLSRTREYYADLYSARVTGAADALSTALVKIAYGIFQADGELGVALDNASGKEKARFRRERVRVGSMALMGISNLAAGQALGLTGAGGAPAEAVMRWDLVNPWARLYELNSTHPLTALRIQALNRESERVHRPVSHPLPSGTRVHWGTFPLEAVLWAAPWVFGVAALIAVPFSYLHHLSQLVVLSPSLAPMLLVFAGVAWALRTWFRYSGTCAPATIAGLMEDVEVSQMRPRAVRLEGTIVGFGVPGAFWCADLVMRDSTGILFVLYKQSIPLARLLFAFTEAANYIGEQVTIEGWFRRGLRPYIEIGRLTSQHGEPLVTRSRTVQTAAAAVVTIAGLVWLVMAR
jgi:heat shock protein HtpX